MAQESVAASDPLFPAIPWGWKFTEQTTAELSRRLIEAGPGARLSLLPYVSGSLLLVKLRVVPAHAREGDAANTDLNDSFPCPPFVSCSGGGG